MINIVCRNILSEEGNLLDYNTVLMEMAYKNMWILLYKSVSAVCCYINAKFASAIC